MPKKKAPPVLEPIPAERVEDARLDHGWAPGKREGDIAGSYSADLIIEGKIRKPFRWKDVDWVCVSLCGVSARAYKVVTAAAFGGKTRTYASGERGPLGFYHGIAVRLKGQMLVLCGPEVTFVGGGEVIKPPISGEADMEFSAKIEAERTTLEFRQKSAKPLDAGRKPIQESPLFGGPAQGGLFDE